jgi:hypothetical protein
MVAPYPVTAVSAELCFAEGRGFPAATNPEVADALGAAAGEFAAVGFLAWDPVSSVMTINAIKRNAIQKITRRFRLGFRR